MYRRILSFSLLILLFVLVVGVASAQSSPALWFVSYWDNKDMEGKPVIKTSEGVIDHDWGNGSPGAGIPKDRWSGQWAAYVDFQPGTYRVTAISDDGVRVYLGDKHIIVDWNEHPKRTNRATVSLKGGRYSMAVDYFEKNGSASLKVGWERVGPPVAGAADVTILTSGPVSPPPAPVSGGQGAWYARYWNNVSLSGNVAAAQYESAINYDWGNGRPHVNVNADHWSASWTANLYFAPGTYRFSTVSDDGIRVFVHDRHVINNWTTHQPTVDSGTITLPGGTYPVQVDYFESGGGAVARVSWERIDGYGQEPPGYWGVSASPVTWLRLRGGPSTYYQILAVAAPGTNLAVIGRTANARWLQVQYRGMVGWMGAGYLRVTGDINTLPITG